MNDYTRDDDERPVSPAKLSRTPSWVMLGFILGAVSVWLLPRDPEPVPAPAITARPPAAEPTAPTERRIALTTLTTIEAVFEAWGEHAVWDDNVTEVAMWSGSSKSFSEFYEVRRTGGVNYFRSIPKLTRLVIRHGKPLPDSPLQFTETEEQYREWREHGRSERPVERASGSGSSSAGMAPRVEPAAEMRLPTTPVVQLPMSAEPPRVRVTPGDGKNP